MALAPIAPWIIPPDYIGAMSRGAQLGLSARAQDEQEKSVGDRLSLAYDTLASEEKRASEAAKASHELASATMAQRAQQAEAMNKFRQDRLDQQGEALNLRENQAGFLNEYRKDRLQQAKDVLDLHREVAQFNAGKAVHAGNKLIDPVTKEVIYDPDANSLSKVDQKLVEDAMMQRRAAQIRLGNTGLDKASRAAFTKQVDEANATLAGILGDKFNPPSVADLGGTNAPALTLPSAGGTAAPNPGVLSRVWSAIKGTPAPAARTLPPLVQAGNSSGVLEPPKVTSRAEFDELPVGAIYIGKGGQKFRKPPPESNQTEGY